MFLILGVSLLYLTTEAQILLYYQCNVGAPVWSAKDSMYLRTDLVL